MLKRFRIVGLCLVAVFALSAVVAATASAHEPTWWYCAKGTAAKEFTDHTCATEKTGAGWIEKELVAGEKLPFVSKMASTSLHKLKASGNTIECTAEKDKGELIGGVPGKDTVTEKVWEKCVFTGFTGLVCEVEGGNITMATPVNTTLRWKGSTGTAALDQFTPTAAGEAFATFKVTGRNCPEADKGTYTVKGEALGEVLPVLALTARVVTKGELFFPCTVLTKYWTGDPPNRVEHTLAHKLEMKEPSGTVQVVEEFCERDEVELSGADAGWGFGVFPEGKVL